jgi:hypothetical protein
MGAAGHEPVMHAIGRLDPDTGRDLITNSGSIHFACVNASHRGQGEAVVTIHDLRWAYCEGTPSDSEHDWVALDPPVGVAELELTRLIRSRTGASRVAVAATEGATQRTSVRRADTRRARREIA